MAEFQIQGMSPYTKDGFESMLLVKGIADIPIPCHDPSYLKIKNIPWKYKVEEKKTNQNSS
jgi:hypothetical protein